MIPYADADGLRNYRAPIAKEPITASRGPWLQLRAAILEADRPPLARASWWRWLLHLKADTTVESRSVA